MHRLLFMRSQDPGSDVKAGLSKLSPTLSLRGIQHVVVKPNLGNPFHVDGVTTHDEVLLAAVEWLRDRFPDVAVVESDGIRYSCAQSFDSTGLTVALPKIGARVVNLSKDEKGKRTLTKHGSLEIPFPMTLSKADLLVSIPVIKSHELTIISGAIKNLFGCIPISDRIRLHPHLDEVLSDLYCNLHPEITIGDGIHVMEGNGPIHGEVTRANLLSFSSNALVHDAGIADVLFHTNWTEVRHLLRSAEKSGEAIETQSAAVENTYGSLPVLSPPKLDLVARTMNRTYKSQDLIGLLYLTPLFPLLNKIAWTYRAAFGRKPKFELHY